MAPGEWKTATLGWYVLGFDSTISAERKPALKTYL